ncbi:hypothetical protein Ancab_001965, partial [Ancistrocladus abbreviatus]
LFNIVAEKKATIVEEGEWQEEVWCRNLKLRRMLRSSKEDLLNTLHTALGR